MANFVLSVIKDFCHLAVFEADGSLILIGKLAKESNIINITIKITIYKYINSSIL